jgi:hypothetical protein
VTPEYLRIADFRPDMILEERLRLKAARS